MRISKVGLVFAVPSIAFLASSLAHSMLAGGPVTQFLSYVVGPLVYAFPDALMACLAKAFGFNYQL